MSDLIRDPFDRTEAIDAATGRMAGKVFMGFIPNPEAPTLRDIQGLTFLGFTTEDPLT